MPHEHRTTGTPPKLDYKAPSRSDWEGPSGSIGAYVAEESNRTLEAYRSQPNRIDEDANREEDTARGGYAHRQLFELVQNGADALAGSSGGRIWLGLTSKYLYCADEGRAIDTDGVKALMFSHLSPKRGTAEIGRFGLGFKSVLGVTDAPEFFSRSGSFCFDREKATGRIRPIAPDAKRYPVLRTAESVDPWPAMEADAILRSLMGWAVNIVRLPLKPGAREALLWQFNEFPAEFLLLVEHVSQLVLQIDGEGERTISLQSEDSCLTLDDGGDKTRWILVRDMHSLSADARSDSRSLDDADEVLISWAAPIDRLSEPGKFWAFFPTMTTSLLSGILNAPWKTNEDRQNLLPGVYNDELIDAAAEMIAYELPRLSTTEDPARHLDALPRRYEAGDSEHSNRLRDQLYSNLQVQDFVPNQAGRLRKIPDISYPPRELTRDGQIAWDSLDRWAAYVDRPPDWLHYSALTRNRLARLGASQPIPRATIAEWLESLVDNADTEGDTLEASMAAIQTAALIPEATRRYEDMGRIVLIADGSRVAPDPDRVSLGGGYIYSAGALVHPDLERNEETLHALKALGIKPASSESVFKELAGTLLRYRPDKTHIDERWNEFWRLARDIEKQAAVEIIQGFRSWSDYLRVRTIDGEWRTLHQTLLPGPIVPADGSRDDEVTIDARFHEPDLGLLTQLGVVGTARSGHGLSFTHRRKFTSRCQECYQKYALDAVKRTPQRDYLTFQNATTSGPLDVLADLSEEGKVRYTEALLALSDTYRQWTMRHNTQDIYPPMDFESPAIEVLRQHGRVETDSGIYPLSQGLGDLPQNRGVLHKMLSHPQADQIRRVFNLQEVDVPVEPVGEDVAVPLLDVWPGLEQHLLTHQKDLQLVRCDGFRRFDGGSNKGEPDCIIRDAFVYVARQEDEEQEIRSVLQELDIPLSDEQTAWILRRMTREEVQQYRDKVRSCSTDEERLLAAVGETELKRRLPRGLITILEQGQGPMTGIRVAQAAISTFHTGALQEYRHALEHLDPPRQWAGGERTIRFVQSLGFGPEWAGERNVRRDPYIDIQGPTQLPKLHDYQQTVVDNIRDLLRRDALTTDRRGMVSMPTGSGKTRVAVQAVVEAIRDDGFQGGILWVADRDELCEQAVEAWREVWASEGKRATQLRISRMWGGQPKPLPTADLHVIVATIQTLSARIDANPQAYEFLSDFDLLVFDEAHRSVAPTFTSVMQELGLTRYRREGESLLIGLTATPYRGRDIEETARLVNRYSSNRLDAGAFDSDEPEKVIRQLQNMGVLARADQATIEGGRFLLSDDERRLSADVPWLPQSVEDRIAANTARTQHIIDEYMRRIQPDWPTLIFATSVEHSKIIAALLSSIGVKARAVSAETNRMSRRRIVEEFRTGEIKALVNYGIFREGFDAPKTRAIIVARPVYSPNLYFQMIGRGLRGVKNGGNDRCLILNVRDNIENFERKLAFSDLDWLWA